MDSYIINMSSIILRYPLSDGSQKTVLNNINLRVKSGEIITLVGPTGCGKSTIMKLVLGSEIQTSGKVAVDGKSPDGPSRNCGIVFQRYNLFPHLTVLDNIMIGLELDEFGLLNRYFMPSYWRRRKEFQAKALAFMDHIKLDPSDAKKYPHQLSGGMQQRVAIARSLIMKPKVLLMDEPFGALDDSTRQRMQEFLLEQWAETNMTIIFVTHDLEEALYLGSRIICLSPYYSNDDGAKVEGSKIVSDMALTWTYPRDHQIKYLPEFNTILETVRNDGLNPDYCQRREAFHLTHCDAQA